MEYSGNILLISDEEFMARYLKEKISSAMGCSVQIEFSYEAGAFALKERKFGIVIVKLHGRDEDDKAFIRKLKAIDQDTIIMCVTDKKNSSSITKELIENGVYEFIDDYANLERIFFLAKKGFELYSMTQSHNKLIQSLKEHNQTLQKQNIVLAKRIEESTKNLTKLYENLRSTYMHTIKVLAHAIDARDHYTHSHSENVARYAVAIAEEMKLSVHEIEQIRDACELHDLGKIGIEDNILSKPSSLTDEEWKQVRKHPLTGAQILEPLTFLDGIIDLVRQHHERFDGKGYPLGLKNEEIMLGARILNLADAFEAMTSSRSYRKEPLTKQQAIEEIKNNNGSQFDPKVVEAFLKIVDKF
ncbi:MAG: HD domain-containing protein [Candidatus Omnitrophota bacterium]|jgi:putative nucleotidyltransferase with HDIG domain|nr:MAG: HD domain-containing protein [Candidatus Omnitrophota bacterium]